ncbi:SAM-dependent methyltransferase [Bacillus haynesii]|uniref:SAM-dependent methyltransferase n=1 Tax=Bacillus haynesii TaxID=1925021 RepID=A0ABX3HYF4_9BACI|nr:class I SAM-dependent methyltransferase [Bacillus haynesii]OMI25075.1 SAM-dependent methyltransferase [Bacillus haynesii]
MKTSAQQQFSKNPEQYRDEPLFSSGKDLDAMVSCRSLNGDETLLDIGTGAGHTAIAFSPFVKHCTGIDITKKMVQTAAQFAEQKKAENVVFQQSDAAQLDFADESFDIVTCRYAAHHFPEIVRSMQEIARVLKQGGSFLLIDHCAPENEALDRFINRLNQLRDPSHVREYSESEWQKLFEENGLDFAVRERWNLPIDYESWLRRGAVPEQRKAAIQAHLSEASQSCRDMFNIVHDENGHPVSFCLKAVLIAGVKA